MKAHIGAGEQNLVESEDPEMTKVNKQSKGLGWGSLVKKSGCLVITLICGALAVTSCEGIYVSHYVRLLRHVPSSLALVMAADLMYRWTPVAWLKNGVGSWL